MRTLSISMVLALLPSGAATSQTTWYVDVNGTPPGTGTALDPYTSIQYAVTRPTTLRNDTVLVAPGTYVENIAFNNGVRVKSSAGPELTLIHAAQVGNTVYISGAPSAVLLEGFTVTPPIGRVPGGPPVAAIHLEDGAIRRCIVRNTTGTGGPGVFVNGSSVVSECTITGVGTGIFLNNFIGDLSLHNSIVTGNQIDVNVTGASIAYISHSAGIANLDATQHGPGNLSGDVGFWDLGNGDLRLRPGSQCIDSGDPASPLDPDGSRIDIGALTFDPDYAPPPTVYCTSKTNSLGCVPSIGSSGTASASGAPFSITCSSELNHRPGLLFYGYEPKGITFQGGYLCVSAPIKRTPLQDSGGTPTGNDCTGAYAFDFDARIQSGIDPALVAGEIVYCQFWSRDGSDPTGFGTNRSDALRFGIGL